MEEANSLNTSLSSVAQYASRLLMHSLDWDTNAVDYRLKERMAECVGDPPMPTPNVCRLLPSLEGEENEAMIRRGCDHGKEMSNSAMEPLLSPLPPTNWWSRRTYCTSVVSPPYLLSGSSTAGPQGTRGAGTLVPRTAPSESAGRQGPA